MGNGIGKECLCYAGAGDISRRCNHDIIINNNNPFGNSICYVRPPDQFPDGDVTHVTTFRSVSGASVSANSSTPPSTTIADSLHHSSSVVYDSSASFESSVSFCTPLHHHALPFDPSPERGFSSVSGPMVLGDGLFNEKASSQSVKNLRRSFSQNASFQNKPKNKKLIFKKVLKRVFSNSQDSKLGFTPRYHAALSWFRQSPKPHQIVVPVCNDHIRPHLAASERDATVDDIDDTYLDDGRDLLLMGNENLQWAQGRAGEDRVHIVISEDQGWIFVGIYDGFNGPDATDYLLDNLFYAVHDELREFLCSHKSKNSLGLVKENGRMVNGKENYPIGNEKINLGHEEKIELKLRNVKSKLVFRHSDVLVALSEALRKTEEAFMKSVDEVISNNPVLAMMGSCVLVMLMKGQDVYLINVGDSRAVLATHGTTNSVQLTMEHSTQVKEEVHRIRKEHPDDPSAITKGRVKGYLNVTRAFGAGFLKHPKQNNAVLESFKVNYIGEYPYLSCCPSLHHHRLSPSDRFLILSSDGLHQYFTNEEAVAKVDSFITSSPDRDPAQLLINEALSRAANKAGMDFYELLDIPQGERRLYHDDISIVIISFQGQIWRSSV